MKRGRLAAPQEVDMTRIWLRTVLFSILGALVFVLVADNSADACHRRHRRRCNDCYNGGCYGGGYAYRGGAYYGGGTYYGGTYGAPVAPYGVRAYGGAEYGAPGARSARGTIEGEGARVDGTLRSPSDRDRGGADIEGPADIEGAGAGARARAGARGAADAPPPSPADDSTLPPPRGERPAEPSSPPSTPDEA
jgi:hypothetical protein